MCGGRVTACKRWSGSAAICPNSVKRSSSVMVLMGDGLLPAEMSCMLAQSSKGMNPPTDDILDASQVEPFGSELHTVM